ncbi:MAG: type VI secretion system-associated protein TagF [Pseudomonadales bacterium]|nr:type VI secretion system-associated protein TagF [Pseudomonadales bacterium]
MSQYSEVEPVETKLTGSKLKESNLKGSNLKGSKVAESKPTSSVPIETGAVGVYGKIPAHGDFVSRRLSPDFIRYWDEWLQRSVSVSQEQLGDRWLDYYLVSPIWRFVLSPGVVDESGWAGVLLPSVDNVGRYFPLTIAMPVKAPSLMDFFVQGEDWFQQVEASALAALHESLSIEELNDRVLANSCKIGVDYSSKRVGGEPGGALQFDMKPEQCPSALFPLMFEQLVRQQYRSYSAWWSQGSEKIVPSFNLTAQLPDASMYASFLDGDWEQRGWQKPYDFFDAKII